MTMQSDEDLRQYLPERTGKTKETSRLDTRDLDIIRRYIVAARSAETETEAVQRVVDGIGAGYVSDATVRIATRKYRAAFPMPQKRPNTHPVETVDGEAREVIVLLARMFASAQGMFDGRSFEDLLADARLRQYAEQPAPDLGLPADRAS